MGEIKKFGPLGKEVREARMSEKKEICEPPACCIQVFFLVKSVLSVVLEQESQSRGFCAVLLRHFCDHFAFIYPDLLQTLPVCLHPSGNDELTVWSPICADSIPLFCNMMLFHQLLTELDFYLLFF